MTMANIVGAFLRLVAAGSACPGLTTLGGLTGPYNNNYDLAITGLTALSGQTGYREVTAAELPFLTLPGQIGRRSLI